MFGTNYILDVSRYMSDVFMQESVRSTDPYKRVFRHQSEIVDDCRISYTHTKMLQGLLDLKPMVQDDAASGSDGNFRGHIQLAREAALI